MNALSEPSPIFDVTAVNAWEDDDSVVVSFRVDDLWRKVRMPKGVGVQLADQLYLLTKTRP